MKKVLTFMLKYLTFVSIIYYYNEQKERIMGKQVIEFIELHAPHNETEIVARALRLGIVNKSAVRIVTDRSQRKPAMIILEERP